MIGMVLAAGAGSRLGAETESLPKTLLPVDGDRTILDSSDDITKHVKWNAPSFRYAGEDRATFRLFPEDRV